MLPIVLAKNFTFVAAAAQVLYGDWVDLGDLSEFQNANIHVHCQTLSPSGGASGLRIDVQSSYDEIETFPVGAHVAVG